MSNIVEEATFKEPEEKDRGIEQAIVDGEKKQEAPVFDPLVTASQIFETYFPIYCKQLDKMSKKQLLRITKSVMGLPLEEGVKPNVKNKQEMDAYYVAERLHQAKLVIMHAAFAERQRKLEDKQAAEKLAAQETVKPEGEV